MLHENILFTSPIRTNLQFILLCLIARVRVRCNQAKYDVLRLFSTVSTFLRATAYNALRVIAIVEVSVCLSHLSVTLCDCIKTVQARITKFSLWAITRTLFFATKLCALR